MSFICKLRARKWPHSKARPETPYHAFPVPPPLTIPRRWLTALTADSSHRSAVSSGWTWCPPHSTVWLSSAFFLSGDGHTRAYTYTHIHTLLKEMAYLHFHFLSNTGWDCPNLPWASDGRLHIAYEYWINTQMTAGSLCWHTPLAEGLWWPSRVWFMEVVPGVALGLVRAFVHSPGAARPWEALRIRFRLQALVLTPSFPKRMAY